MIEMCSYYTTTDWPDFKPRCRVGLKASLKCHSWSPKCPRYIVAEHDPIPFILYRELLRPSSSESE